jgi:NADH-quinone oxidoreductase subunit M
VLSAVIFLPLAGAALIAFLPRSSEGLAKWLGALVSAVVFAFVVGLFIAYDRDEAGYQFLNQLTWLDSDFSDFKLQYAVALDGLSLPLVLLTSFLGLVAVLISWRIDLRP